MNMKRICIINVLLFVLAGCASAPPAPQKTNTPSDYKSELSNMETMDGIDRTEAELIFESFVMACFHNTTFTTFTPIKHENLWLSQVYGCGVACLPTIRAIVLEEETGAMSYGNFSISHFTRMWEECDGISPRQFLAGHE